MTVCMLIMMIYSFQKYTGSLIMGLSIVQFFKTLRILQEYL